MFIVIFPDIESNFIWIAYIHKYQNIRTYKIHEVLKYLWFYITIKSEILLKVNTYANIILI